MRRHRLWGALALAAAALLLTPAVGSAQISFGRGGFGVGSPYYGGTGWGGMGWGSGYYGTGYSPYYGGSPMWNSGYGFPSNYGYNSPAYSGWYGSNSPGYSNWYGTPSYTWGNSPSSAWSNYNGAWGNYPATGSTGYYSGSGAPSYYGGSYPMAGGSGYAYGNRPRTEQNAALVNVRLPDPNAEVWIDGKKTQSKGTVREFESPPLDPGKNYTYEVKARWTENGKDREVTKTVPVRANGVATADFTASADRSRIDNFDRSGERGGTGTDNRNRNPELDRNPKTNPDTTKPGSDKKPGDTTRPDDKTRPGDTPPDKQ